MLIQITPQIFLFFAFQQALSSTTSLYIEYMNSLCPIATCKCRAGRRPRTLRAPLTPEKLHQCGTPQLCRCASGEMVFPRSYPAEPKQVLPRSFCLSDTFAVHPDTYEFLDRFTGEVVRACPAQTRPKYCTCSRGIFTELHSEHFSISNWLHCKPDICVCEDGTQIEQGGFGRVQLGQMRRDIERILSPPELPDKLTESMGRLMGFLESSCGNLEAPYHCKCMELNDFIIQSPLSLEKLAICQPRECICPNNVSVDIEGAPWDMILTEEEDEVVEEFAYEMEEIQEYLDGLSTQCPGEGWPVQCSCKNKDMSDILPHRTTHIRELMACRPRNCTCADGSTIKLDLTFPVTLSEEEPEVSE